MQIEIWDREAIDGDRAVPVTMSSVNGTVTQHANYETAFEYLHGLVKELKAAVDTAEVMYLRKPNTRIADTGGANAIKANAEHDTRQQQNDQGGKTP